MIDFAELERRNGPVGAFVDFDRAATYREGPLAGVSVGVKSNLAVAGLPWTAGMGLRRAIVAQGDAEVVARLRAAGAAILGTLNMHEAALGSTTDNPFYGRTQNPYRFGYTPGGSSGGSAAAVAAGLCDLALGTDTLGSIRIPAAYCGVYGLKPTADAVPCEGLVMLDPAFDAIGLFARSLDLLECAWQVIADHPGSSTSFTRLVVLPDHDNVSVEPAVHGAWARAVAAVSLPSSSLSLAGSLDALRLAAFAKIGRTLSAALGESRHGEGLSDELRFVISAALGIPETPQMLATAGRSLREALGDDGVLIMPTAPQVAFAHTSRPPPSQPLFTALASIAGCPALACPAGWDQTGLPVGVQLVGPPGSELGLIDLARSLEPVLGGFNAPLAPV